jgi:hypothetical protein
VKLGVLMASIWLLAGCITPVAITPTSFVPTIARLPATPEALVSSVTPSPLMSLTPLPHESGSPSAVISQPTPVAPALTTPAPPATMLPPATATTGTQSSGSATAELPHAALPNVLLNISSPFGQLGYCRRDGETVGQIWSASYPYSTTRRLLSDPLAGYYNPTWSPDGQWVAYVVSNPRDGRQEGSPDALIVQYPNSDSVWLMHPDGSGQRQIGPAYARIEVLSPHNSGPSCDLVGGLADIEGWSPDGKWVIVTYGRLDAGFELHAINSTTGLDYLLTSNLWPDSTVWQTNRDALALLGSSPDHIESIAFGTDAFGRQYIAPPSDFAAGYHLMTVQWDGNSNSLLVASKTRSVPSDLPVTLWRVDLTTEQWQKLLDIGPAQEVSLFSGQEGRLLCQDGKLSLRDPETWALSQAIDGSGDVECDTRKIGADLAGQSVVGFVGGATSRQIWGTTVTSGTASFKVLDGDRNGLPKNFRIIDFDWQR